MPSKRLEHRLGDYDMDVWYFPVVYRRIDDDGTCVDVLVANADLSWDMVTSEGEKIHVPGPPGFVPLASNLVSQEETAEHILLAIQSLVDKIGELYAESAMRPWWERDLSDRIVNPKTKKGILDSSF